MAQVKKDSRVPRIDLSTRKLLGPYGQNLAAAVSPAEEDRSAIERLVKVGVKPGVKVGGKPAGTTNSTR